MRERGERRYVVFESTEGVEQFILTFDFDVIRIALLTDKGSYNSF